MPEDLPIFFAYQQDPDAVRMAAFPARDRDAFDAHWTRVLQDVPAPPLHAHVAKSNGGSLRVLERCGFSIVGEDQAPAVTGREPVDEFVLRLDPVVR